MLSMWVEHRSIGKDGRGGSMRSVYLGHGALEVGLDWVRPVNSSLILPGCVAGHQNLYSLDMRLGSGTVRISSRPVFLICSQ